MVRINSNLKTGLCFKDSISTPLGGMFFVVSSDSTLLGLSFSDDIFLELARVSGCNKMLPVEEANGAGEEITRQLVEYFEGMRKEFNLAVGFFGTPFQIAVWSALLDIPYGETASYGDVARRIGYPNAYRAVGSAVGKNRIDIVVPCHRVIKGDGSMGNYGGGIDKKRYLLNLEATREVF